MTPEQFITRWQANTRNEAAASKEHFLNLCELLGVPSPNSDATGATYAFEKGVTKAAGGGGWADVWKRGCFGWEYKSRGADLNKAHDQLLRYAGALENPPLLVSSDMDRIVVRTNWTNVVSETSEFRLDDLRDAAVVEVDGTTARQWLCEPANPNGAFNAQVLRPWWNGDDVVGRPRDFWIVDFADMLESEAAYFSSPYAHVSTHVRPVRATVERERRRRLWWQFNEPAPGLRRIVAGLRRFIVTPEVSKHRVFAWCSIHTLPDKNLVVIACDDDASFGVLQSRFHEVWALRLGTSLEDRPRYTSSTTFRTFPFPPGLTLDIPAAAYADNPHAQAIAAAARALVEARDRWLNPPDLVERVPDVVPGFPDRILPRNAKAAAVLKTRTLTNLYNTRGKPEGVWLDGLHAALDAAVAAAYGWPADISDEDTLARLLALNMERARPEDACRPKVA